MIIYRIIIKQKCYHLKEREETQNFPWYFPSRGSTPEITGHIRSTPGPHRNPLLRVSESWPDPLVSPYLILFLAEKESSITLVKHLFTHTSPPPSRHNSSRQFLRSGAVISTVYLRWGPDLSNGFIFNQWEEVLVAVHPCRFFCLLPCACLIAAYCFLFFFFFAYVRLCIILCVCFDKKSD